jgi:two-component system sensor histidine kinase BarA
MVNEWGIKARVLFLTLVPTIVISLLLSAYFTSSRLQDLETALRDRGYALALQMAPASEYGVYSGNARTLHELTKEARSDPEVLSVTIFNREGHVLAKDGHDIDIKPPELPTLENQSKLREIIVTERGNSLFFTAPVFIRDIYLDDFNTNLPPNHPVDLSLNQVTTNTQITRDHILGWITIEISRADTTLRQFKALVACSIIVLIGLGISSIFAFRMGRDVTRPILEMAYAVEKIKDGNLDARVYTNARGELRLLDEGINSMAQSLKAAHEEMQQSVEQATADLRQTLETIEIQNIELEMARKEAETASRVKSEFLANMSHEIRTPLNGVIGFINLLTKTELNYKQIDYLQTIKKSASSLMTIINDILDFSKMEAGKLRLDNLSMDLRECIEDALTLLAPQAHEKALELVPLVYSDVPTKILGDHLRLKQIITNLVSNSIKFTEKGSVIVRIMLEKDSGTQVVLCVSVTDSGIGLTNEEQKTLFQAFRQADSTSTRKYGGTGLGLVISKRLVQQMGGEIGVESESGKGSTFWFTFVAEKVLQDTPPSKNLNGYRFLLYEQHPTSRLAINHLLGIWGCSVHELNDISQLESELERVSLNNQPYHMLLLGMNQPDLNSHFVEDCVKKATGRYQVPVGVLPNTTDEVVTKSIIEAGAAFCLSKPVRLHNLYDSLCQLLVHDYASQLNLIQINNLSDEGFKANKNPPSTTGKQFEVLAVDDYPANLKLLKALLEDSGIKITGVTSGKEALQYARLQEFDLILMDIQMPGMDGLEVTDRIRQLPTGKEVPIIALTAHALVSERQALLQAGFDDYLSKPIQEIELLNMIKKWVKKKPPIVANVIPETEPLIYDWQMALKLTGNKPEIAKEMLTQLVAMLPKEKQAISLSYENKDYLSLREKVHHLHGATCYCGVPRLKNALHKLETLVAQFLSNPSKNKTAFISELDSAIEKTNLEIRNLTEVKAEIECYED